MAESSWSGEKALVTGGAGFIGSHLVDALLAAGARVTVLDDFSTGTRANLAAHPLLEVIAGDLRDAALCRRAAADASVIFHQAALGSVPRSMADPAASIAVNVAGTAAVFAAARDAGVGRVVYASSSSVYGESPVQPRREGEEGEPLSPYALSKVMCEELAAGFARCFGLELIGLRYFNVYGPRQNPRGPYAAVIPRFIAALERGEAPEIYGDGRQSRDFTAIADVVTANLLAARAPASSCGRAYNVGAGGSVSVLEIAERLAALIGTPLAPRHLPERAGDVRSSQADLAAVRAALGYAPTVELATGLAATVAWFRAHPERL